MNRATKSIASIGRRLAEGRSHLERALELLRAARYPSRVADVLTNLGFLAEYEDDFETATAAFDEALRLRELTADLHGIAAALNNVGDAAYWRGDLETAKSMQTRSLEIRRRIGDRQGVEISLYNLAMIHLSIGIVPSARQNMQDSLKMANEIGSMVGIGDAVRGMACIRLLEGRAEEGARLWGVAYRVLQDTHIRSHPAELRAEANWLDRFHRALGVAAFDENRERGAETSLDLAIAAALE